MMKGRRGVENKLASFIEEGHWMFSQPNSFCFSQQIIVIEAGRCRSWPISLSLSRLNGFVFSHTAIADWYRSLLLPLLGNGKSLLRKGSLVFSPAELLCAFFEMIGIAQSLLVDTVIVASRYRSVITYNQTNRLIVFQFNFKGYAIALGVAPVFLGQPRYAMSAEELGDHSTILLRTTATTWSAIECILRGGGARCARRFVRLRKMAGERASSPDLLVLGSYRPEPVWGWTVPQHTCPKRLRGLKSLPRGHLGQEQCNRPQPESKPQRTTLRPAGVCSLSIVIITHGREKCREIFASNI